MVKECLVVLNNDVVTVVKFDDVDIQFPSIQKEAQTVFVNYESGKYSIVDEHYKAESVDKPKKKNDTIKKATINNDAIGKAKDVE